MKRYYKVKDTDNQYLKTEVYYNLGGYNYFTGASEKRGFYMSVSPVTKSRNSETYQAFSGSKILIVPCQRKSKSKEKEAITIYEENINTYIEKYFTEYSVDLNVYEEII